MKRCLLAAVLVCLLFAGVAVQAQEQGQLGESAALLTQPGGVSQGTLQQGTEVTVLEQVGNWVKVSVVGWVPKALLPTPSTDPASISRATEWKDAGDGFWYRNCGFRSTYNLTKVMGEIQNRSGKSFSVVSLTVTVYDSSGRLFAVSRPMLAGMSDGTVKTFEGLFDVELPSAFDYKVQLDMAF